MLQNKKFTEIQLPNHFFLMHVTWFKSVSENRGPQFANGHAGGDDQGEIGQNLQAGKERYAVGHRRNKEVDVHKLYVNYYIKCGVLLLDIQ